jgi:hypothetical protein
MPFNAKDFRSHFVSTGGFAQSNYFEVVFTMPEILKNKRDRVSTFDEKTKMRAHMVDMPARTLETLDRRYAGPMRNIPVGHTYTTLQLEFIEGADRKTREFFDTWQEVMMDNTNGWNVPYYNDVVCPYIQLNMYNKWSNKVAASYLFYECFPVSIATHQLAWENQNQVIRVPIELAYHRWENTKTTPGPYKRYIPITDEDNGEIGLLGRLKRIQKQYRSIVKTVNQVKSTVQFYKQSAKNLKQVFKTIRNFKPNFRSLNGIAETIERAGRIGEQSIRTVESATKPAPIFKSSTQRTKIPSQFRIF